MIAGLLFAALFSVALAAPQVGDFQQGSGVIGGDVFDEEALRDMTEVVAEKILAMAEKTDEAIEVFKKTEDDYVNPLMETCSRIRVELQKAVKDTVAKGMEKKKPLDAFLCITTRAGESYRRLDAIKVQIQSQIHRAVQNVVDPAEGFKLALKHLNEYVKDLFIDKSNELSKAGSDADRRNILSYVRQKMVALETLLKNLQRRLANMSRSLNDELWRTWFSNLYWLRKVESEQVARIKQCVP